MNTLQVIICAPGSSAGDYAKSLPGSVLCTQQIDDSNISYFRNLLNKLFAEQEKEMVPYNDSIAALEPDLSGKTNSISIVEISEVLANLGMPANLLGYKYLRAAIQIAVKDATLLGSITKVIYPTVAKEFRTTPSNVERSIRHAIEVAWDRGDIDKLHKRFGYSIDPNRGRPTNAEFISRIVDDLLLKA